MSWQAKNTASSVPPRVTRNADCYLSSMRRRRSPYLPRAIRNDNHAVGIVRRTDHHAVGTKRQLWPNSSPPHRHVKTEAKQLGIIHTTFGRTWTVEQDTPDQSTDREDVLRRATMATHLDVINPITPGPNAADGLHQSYVAVWPIIGAPRTLFASLTK